MAVTRQRQKEMLVDDIIFKCKLSNVAHNKHIPLDEVFINLACASNSALISIASELNIPIPKVLK